MKSLLKFEEMYYLIDHIRFKMGATLFYLNYLSYFQH